MKITIDVKGVDELQRKLDEIARSQPTSFEVPLRTGRVEQLGPVNGIDEHEYRVEVFVGERLIATPVYVSDHAERAMASRGMDRSETVARYLLHRTQTTGEVWVEGEPPLKLDVQDLT